MTERQQSPRPIVSSHESEDNKTRTTVRIVGLDNPGVKATPTTEAPSAIVSPTVTASVPSESQQPPRRRTTTVPQAVGVGAVGGAIDSYSAPRGTALPGTTLFEGKISNVVKIWTLSERKKIAMNTAMPIKPKTNKISGAKEYTEQSTVWKEAKKRMKTDALIGGVVVSALAVAAFAVSRDGSSDSSNNDFSRIVPVESPEAQAGIEQSNETTPATTTPGGFNPEFTTESDTGRFSRENFENAFEPEVTTSEESSIDLDDGEAPALDEIDIEEVSIEELIASFTGPEIALGSSGPQVIGAQQALVLNGCDIGPDGVDGNFGEDTAFAAALIQDRTGIKSDGRIGDETQGVIAKGIEQGSQKCGADINLDL